MMQLRRLTDDGVRSFERLLDGIPRGEYADPLALRDDPELTEALSDEPVVRVAPFASRREAGEYFYYLLLPFEDHIPDIERDRGLWSWLALAWIDLLAPADDSGYRSLGRSWRWVPTTEEYRTYYRHLLAGPYRIYRAHAEDPDRAMAVLATAVAKPGDVVEQIASRQAIVTSASLLAAVTRLYYDAGTGVLRTGAAGKGAGSSRRLVDVLLQLDLTWDFYEMPPEHILALLPGEFDRFRT